MVLAQTVSTVDYHTAGEPFRVVTEGVPTIEGASILDKRRYAAEHLDHIRRLVVFEPRGHADMYGGFVVEPDDAGADLGVVFFHNAGYSTACGHGTIALVTWAIETGALRREGERAEVVVDVPSGRLKTVARLEGRRVTDVRFRNVPSYVHGRGIEVEADGLAIVCDISFGGAFYANVDAAALGIPVAPRNVDRFISLGRRIKAAIEDAHEVVHPLEPELRDVYGVIFYETAPDRGGRLVQRNVTIFADGEVDRSPCGSGTSARLACLDADGTLERGRELLHLSIIDTEFVALVVDDADVDGRRAVVTEVEGSAHPTGQHRFVLDPEDPVGYGFLLR